MLLIAYNYFTELYHVGLWFGLILLVLYIGLRLTGRNLTAVPPAILVYLFVFCWAKATFMEAYNAKDIVGYKPQIRTEGGWLSDNSYSYECQEPIYAHESRGHAILWLGPFVAMAGAMLYDISRSRRHSLYIAALFIPFLLFSYLCMAGEYLFDSDSKPCNRMEYH
ncbi:hypothetical protein EJV47_11425 [Hymenobacter gummosus]|uniref:Uncharacterized protein n=1 Tax=Hymenobacter gummosus TaxID=1776032 RepID=A0A431U456_9BACT|nr:hypothetical protein [Hymenobacter gummosus]RTQ50231.1 hypothetical protein EJV47_11425 [Hymenobacter gummosus]